MRQKKNFFTKNNRLDKVGTSNSKDVNSAEESFLDPKNLADFEKASPGFSDKLFSLAKDEQVHNQKMNQIKASIYRNANRMGRVSFVFIFVAICYFSYNLIINNLVNEGFIFAAMSFASLIMINCTGSNRCEKKEEKIEVKKFKPPFKKTQSRKRHFNKRK